MTLFSPPFMSPPVAPESNPPIESQFFQPSRFVISGITLGVRTTVTTTVNHNYVVGQLVRLIIPPSFGSRQINESQGYVLSIPSGNQVLLDINSSKNVDPYVSSTATTVAQILSTGEINFGSINGSGRVNLGTTIPGAFINIS